MYASTGMQTILESAVSAFLAAGGQWPTDPKQPITIHNATLGDTMHVRLGVRPNGDPYARLLAVEDDARPCASLNAGEVIELATGQGVTLPVMLVDQETGEMPAEWQI